MAEVSTSHIILIRHGQTSLNAEGRLRGLANPELDSTGFAEANAVARVLRTFGIGRVISSPLRRAVMTAHVISGACGIIHTVDPVLTDRDYGPWTGQVKADVIKQWGSIDAAPGVEPKAAVSARALRALNTLTQASDGTRTAAVTHDAVIRSILADIQPGIDPIVGTASWTELTHDARGWTITSIDNIAR